MKTTHSKIPGFSLVELAIVLVILGLLVGGILTGKHLIRSAELRGVVSEYQNYVMVTRSFREKYLGLPGDLANATQFWGQVAAGDANSGACSTTPSTDQLTCNGDGNGSIGWTGFSGEPTRYWQHLANAGLISGNFNGTTTIPDSKLKGASVTLRENHGVFNCIFALCAYFNGTNVYGPHFFVLSSSTASSLMTPVEAYGIDTKLDDGNPAVGTVVVWANPNVSYCTDAASSSATTANYLLTSENRSCGLAFRQLRF